MDHGTELKYNIVLSFKFQGKAVSGTKTTSCLPERWYLAALWPQWERQLGRERRLRASTERAAITAPITQLPQLSPKKTPGADEPNEPNEWSGSRCKVWCVSAQPARAKRECLDLPGSSKTAKRLSELLQVLICFCLRPHLKICLSRWRDATARDGEREKSEASNDATELLTFHITAPPPPLFYVCLTLHSSEAAPCRNVPVNKSEVPRSAQWTACYQPSTHCSHLSQEMFLEVSGKQVMTPVWM